MIFTLVFVTGVNMTSKYFTDSQDFQTDNYFKKNLVGASFTQGAFTFKDDGSGACEVLVDGVPTPNYVMLLFQFCFSSAYIQQEFIELLHKAFDATSYFY